MTPAGIFLIASVAVASPPTPSDVYEFEGGLRDSIPHLKYARYVTNDNLSLATLVAWTEEGGKLSDPQLFAFRRAPKPVALKVTQDVVPAARRNDLKAFSYTNDRLSDEDPTSAGGKFLSGLLKALSLLAVDETKPLRLISNTPDWRALVHGADEGKVAYSGAGKSFDYKCEPGKFSELVSFIDAEPSPADKDDAKLFAGARGGLVHFDPGKADGKIRLRLSPAWANVGKAIATGDVILLDATKLSVLPDNPLGKTLPVKPDLSDLVERLVFSPPAKPNVVVFDPLVWLIQSK